MNAVTRTLVKIGLAAALAFGAVHTGWARRGIGAVISTMGGNVLVDQTGSALVDQNGNKLVD